MNETTREKERGAIEEDHRYGMDGLGMNGVGWPGQI
jgi:hypothetical protein